MFKNKTKKLIFFLTIIGLFAIFSSVFAQNFGTNEVSTGLNNSLSTVDPRQTAGRIINIVLSILGVIAVGIIIWGGFVWLTSNGEEEKITSAKNILKNGVIGLVIILASWGIALFILNQLGGAINGNGNGICTSGEVQSCGCGGSMSCNGGTWGSCIGSSCDGGNKPTSCDSSPNPGCQAANQICDPADYCDSADCSCKLKGNPGDSCDANLTNGTCDADNNLCGQYLSCDSNTCLCFGPPVITGISPVGGFCQDNPNKSCLKDFDCGTTCNLNTPNGAVSNFITISGKSFGAYSSSTSKVIFEGAGSPVDGRQPIELNSACVNTWKDNEIVIAVPGGAGTGPIKVINKDNLSDETNNDYGPKIDDFQVNTILRPGLCSLNPNQGALSDSVNYQGFSLYSGNAYFGNYQSNVQGITSNFSNPQGLNGSSIIPNIQPGNSSSFVISNLNGNKQSSNSLSFTKDQEVGAGPYIISFSPTAGNTGQYVTIRGNGFGPTRGSSHVYFDNLEAAYDFPDVCLNSVWKDNQIIVKVPANLPDAYHLIKIKLGTTTIDSSKVNPNTFRSDKNLNLLSSICKIEPDNGPVATPVGLWGENFGPVNSEALVKFNIDKSATGTIIKDGRADSFKTIVPAGAITGPVKVLQKGLFGNEINFTVGSCQTNSDCGAAQVCCPDGTYRQGRCFGSLDSCSSDVPTSVYEFGFSTSFIDIVVDPYYSCAGLANKLGACQVGTTCPNTPGTCSPYAGGNKIIGQNCDFSCAAVPGCSVLGTNICSYDLTINKCVKSGANNTCDLAQKFTYNLGGQDKEFSKTCDKDNHWEITTAGSCPASWTRATGNVCVDLNSNCSPCETGLACTAGSGGNRCVSNLICPSGSTCEKNNDSSGAGKCVSKDEATCGCCCTIGQDKQDCCSYIVKETGVVGQLTCGGTCGSDTGRIPTLDNPITLGKCGGCAAAGKTPAEQDAACNCTGHSGQYCDINDSHPQGVCSDCTSLADKASCTGHGAACCFDSKKTSTSTDDFCRGGDKITTGTDAGYCAYYNCQSATSVPSGNPKLCNTATPVKLGFFNTIDKCTATSTGCSSNPGADYCSFFDGNQGACLAEDSCCFDKNDSKCKGSERISSGPSKGYCAYYNCYSGAFKNICNSIIASTTGAYISTSTCAIKCANPSSGVGVSCVGTTTIPVLGQAASITCAFNQCNFPGFYCLTASSTLGALPDCGTCCCQPGLATDSCITPSTPNLHCQADQGNCSGAGRGLCCGCSKDTDCGDYKTIETIGCGLNSCCQARPRIATTSPAHLATAVCRNAVIKVGFDQLMDISSSNNLILLEEKSSGICQTGYLADDSIRNLVNNKQNVKIVKIYQDLSSLWNKIISLLSGQALASIPDSKKIYCLVPGSVQTEDKAKTSTLVFSPKKLLNPNANYYLVVLGDEDLNSQSGVISLAGIGFNGEGYLDPSTGTYVEGKLIKFNNKVYKNAYISKFTTSAGENSVCKIDHISVNPNSYLFSTTVNDLNENDVNPLDKNTFDSVADKDKVFAAWAYSADGQILQPVTGYFWDWNWQIENTQVAAISSVVGLANNKSFVSAVANVTDDSTKLKATVNMSRFQGACNTCECRDANCSNNCCNDYSTGDLTSATSNLYVFLCQNPWPPVASDGTWSPWQDNCDGSITGNCSDYNYKFYYCRDTGNNATIDDLPAIIHEAVIRGQSTNLVCSSDHLPCSALNTLCGSDKDGNGIADGICIWNVLKESYFFREAIPQGGQIISATDNLIGGSINIAWRMEVASAASAASYKIYYLKAGQSEALTKEVTPGGVCELKGSFYDCNTDITGLTTGVAYIFKISIVSANKTENLLYGELSKAPSDQTPPSVPIGLKEIKNNQLIFTWTANNDDTKSYLLYHGTASLNYGESYPSAIKATSIAFDLNKFGSSTNYFALSAVDAYGNESGKSIEISIN